MKKVNFFFLGIDKLHFGKIIIFHYAMSLLKKGALQYRWVDDRKRMKASGISRGFVKSTIIM
jgi:hypothetical protein